MQAASNCTSIKQEGGGLGRRPTSDMMMLMMNKQTWGLVLNKSCKKRYVIVCTISSDITATALFLNHTYISLLLLLKTLCYWKIFMLKQCGSLHCSMLCGKSNKINFKFANVYSKFMRTYENFLYVRFVELKQHC